MSVFRGFSRLLLAAVCAAALSTAANAADAVVDEAVILEPGFTWTGLYIGANAGYSWGDFDHELDAEVDFLGAFSTDLDADVDGISGGVQIGYNWQVGSFVLGVEADVQAADLEGAGSEAFIVPLFANVEVEAETEIDWFGTARLRFGYVPTERLMIYGTGGFAFGETTSTASYVADTLLGIFTDSVSDSASRTGWAAGAGAEYAFADNWTVKAEYLYTDLGEEDVFSFSEDFFTADLTSDVKFHTVRLGVNYKF